MLAFVAVASAIEYPGYQHHSSHGGHAYEAAPVYHAAPVHYAAPAVVKSSPGKTIFEWKKLRTISINLPQSTVYHAAPVVKTVAAPVYKHVEYEHEAPPKYDFSYSVHDTETGDIKQQQESRDGDVVHGSYSLYDADGHHRVVEYTADDHNGFNAVVRREPSGHKVAAAPVHKVIAPVHKIVAAPQVYHAEPQVHYTAPVAKVVSHAPVAHYVAPVAKVAQYSHDAAHVSYNGPSSNYHY